MRIYLDTNILAFLLTDMESIDRGVKGMLEDCTNTFYTSSACVMELIHLFQIGKLTSSKRHKLPEVTALLDWIDDSGVVIEPVNRRHLQMLSELPLYDDHRDPNDRLIVAQAIADRAALISSDAKMERYRRHGLDFVFNRR